MPSSSGLRSPRRINRVNYFLFPQARSLRIDLNDGVIGIWYTAGRTACDIRPEDERLTHRCLHLILFINKCRGIDL